MGIRNCNKRFCTPDNPMEQENLWEVGKQVGMLCRGEEMEVITEYGRMEVRDEEMVKDSQEGGNMLCNDNY